jgi:hypothetical protein
MFSSRIRTTIIAFVASASFAVAALVPTVSQAQWHNYCVAGHCITHANYTIGGCEAIKANYNNAYEGLLQAIEPRSVLVNGPSGPQVEEERAHQIEEEEARVREAERAAFESGCDVVAAHTSSTPVNVVTAPSPSRAALLP